MLQAALNMHIKKPGFHFSAKPEAEYIPAGVLPPLGINVFLLLLVPCLHFVSCQFYGCLRHGMTCGDRKERRPWLAV